MKGVKARHLFIIAIIPLLMIPNVVAAQSPKNELIESNKHIKAQTEHKQVKLNPFINRMKQTKQSSIQSNKKVDPTAVKDRRIIVHLNSKAEIDYASLGVTAVETKQVLREHGIQIVKVNSNFDYNLALTNLRNCNSVISAEPDYKKKLKYVPSDPMISNEWYINKIHLPETWDITQGTNTVTIAVIDSGVSQVPDLEGKLLPGYDFVNNDDDPSDDYGQYGHGTSVAGIIAATANNNEGGVGVDFNTRILPIKVAGTDGTASDSTISEGIYYAIDHGANVINLSLGGQGYDSVLEQAVWDAYNAGIVLIAAAGNEGVSTPDYPASYAPVISVSATDQNDQIASFSNIGDWIDVAAPGVVVFGPSRVDSYVMGDGTSFASPIVAGIAALIKGIHPEWTPAQIEWAIEKGTDQTTGWNEEMGYGRVNAFKALSQTVDNTDKISDDPDLGTPIQNNTPVSDTINMPMDEDYYKFVVNTKSPVTIKIDGVTQSEDLDGDLLKKENNQWVEVQTIDTNGKGLNEEATIELDPGTYAIGVYDYFNHWSTSPYQLEVSGITTTVTPTPVSISDIKGHWAENEITYLINQGIVDGYSNGTFLPDNNITRAEAAKLIASQLKLPTLKANFPDVPSGYWAADFIGACANEGIITGYDNGTFKPDNNLSRVEMATILKRAYKLGGQTTAGFSDVEPDYWGYDSVEALLANKITNGYDDGTFRPENSITRAEFSVMLARVLNDSFKK